MEVKATKEPFQPRLATASKEYSRIRGGKTDLTHSADISALLCNIKNGVSPYNYKNGDVDVKDAIELCQKAYWNVSIFRLTIDIMTEFANSPIHFRGKDKAANKFFKAWYKKINGWKIGDQFFRELFRSTNIFTWRSLGNLDIGKKTLVQIPIKYSFLNPADINCAGGASFMNGNYQKVLNSFEISQLKNPQDASQKAFKLSLPQAVREAIDKGSQGVAIPLDEKDVRSVFFKKQDYEPFAVPMYFPVLFDINLKLELKKADLMISKACEYMILLITMGDKDNGVDQTLVDYVNELFKNSETVGRVFVSDWTTEMEFVIPDLKKVLGPEKYESVNNDIANGLMNIFFGDSKYADAALKINVFLERLKEARKCFVNEFLVPEMEIICEKLGFNECPTPVFEKTDLKKEEEFYKIYNRLAELGYLTPEELFETCSTHLLPEADQSIESQKQFKKLRDDEGLYKPANGKSFEGEKGRPSGGTQKQKQKTVSPVGASEDFNLDKLSDVVKESDNLIKKVSSEYKTIHNLERLSKRHQSIAKEIAMNIVAGEDRDNWDSKIGEYINNPLTVGPKNNETLDICAEKGYSFGLAALSRHCKV